MQKSLEGTLGLRLGRPAGGFELLDPIIEVTELLRDSLQITK